MVETSELTQEHNFKYKTTDERINIYLSFSLSAQSGVSIIYIFKILINIQ
jgi:hypothetical protein